MRSLIAAFALAVVFSVGFVVAKEERVILEHRMGETEEFTKRTELSITYHHGVATSIKLVENQTQMPATVLDGSEVYQIRIASGDTCYVAAMDPVHFFFLL